MSSQLLLYSLVTLYFICLLQIEVKTSSGWENCHPYGICQNDWDCKKHPYLITIRQCSNSCCRYFGLIKL
nr:hypothetical protein BgiMline_024628 [Biomphalaria glabrata]